MQTVVDYWLAEVKAFGDYVNERLSSDTDRRTWRGPRFTKRVLSARISHEEHRLLALRFKALREGVLEAYVDASNIFGKSSPNGKAMKVAFNTWCARYRERLDAMLYRSFPRTTWDYYDRPETIGAAP